MNSSSHEINCANVNLAILRSQLVQSCASLRNLTLTDLETCKWSVRKNIFSNLIESSQALYDYHIRLEELLERKNKDVAIQKQRNTPREKVIEQEHMFRSNFMNIVLDCLTYIRWPPANEAFSDPLGQLLSSDNAFVCSAIAYMATHTLPQPAAPRPNSSRQHISSPAVKENDNLKYEEVSSNARHALSVNNISNISEANTVDTHHLNSIDMSGMSANGKTSNRANKADGNISQTTEYSTPASTSSMSGMQHVIEILQKQNELLQERVNNMQSMINARIDGEEHLNSIVNEIVGVVLNIKETTAINKQTGSDASSKDTIPPSLDIDQKIRNRISGKSVSGSMVSKLVDNQPTATGMWSSVHNKLTKLQQNWNECRKMLKMSSLMSIKSDNERHENNQICARNVEHDMDISKIHTIQQNVVNVHVSASRILDDLYKEDESGVSLLQSLTLDARVHQLNDNILDFVNHTDQLSIDCADVLPLSVVASTCNPASSKAKIARRSSPALDNLINKITELSKQRKPNFEASNYTNLMEHAIAENMVLQRSKSRSLSILKQWYARIALPLCQSLSTFSNDVTKKVFSTAVDGHGNIKTPLNTSRPSSSAAHHATHPVTVMDKLDALCSTFHNFCSIISSAEAAKISQRGMSMEPCEGEWLPPPPSPEGLEISGIDQMHTARSIGSISTIPTNTMVSPMKMLSRGFLGQEVSLLIQYVQLHKNTISNTAKLLKNIKSEFQMVLSESLKNLKNRQLIVESGLKKVEDFLQYEAL